MKQSVSKLLLDPENPRLPQDLQGQPQSALFDYLYDNAVLDELADSMLDNGFFEHEPLIVLPPTDDGFRVVVEGNRRLAALMLIHGHAATGERELSKEPSQEQLERLREVPVFEVSSREDVRRFLGYRHISGLKPWRPEAKARYIVNEVDEAYRQGDDGPFLYVARRVGSNTQGIRNSYIALAILRHGREECGVDTIHLLNERFGVWLRAMNSPGIRGYLGLGNPKTYSEVLDALGNLDCERLGEVVDDMTPRKGKSAVLGDSRDVTRYGLVIQSSEARSVLRKYGDLDIAAQVITEQSLASRAEEIAKRIDALREEVQRGVSSTPSDLSLAAQAILRSARLLNGAVEALSEK